jgi:hypothetical protein
MGEGGGEQRSEVCPKKAGQSADGVAIAVVILSGTVSAEDVQRLLKKERSAELVCCFWGESLGSRTEGSLEIAISQGAMSQATQIKTPMHLNPDRFTCVQRSFDGARLPTTADARALVRFGFGG